MTIATFPAYDNTAETEWLFGCDLTATTGVDDGATGTTAGWLCRSMRLRLNPGIYTLKTLHAMIANAADASCDAVRVGILSGTTTAAELLPLSNGSTYVDVVADKANTNNAQHLEGDLGDVTVTLPEGKTYWVLVMFHKVQDSVDTRPGTKQMADDEWVLGDLWRGQVNGAIADMPTDTADLTYVVAGDVTGEQTRICLQFATAARILYSIDSTAYAGTAVEMILPRLESTDAADGYWIFLKESVVAAGEALTVVEEWDDDSSEATRTTLVQDMGATDQMTFGSADVSLAGGGVEADATFDLGICVRGNSRQDLFWINRTKGQGGQGDDDLITISHACKDATARNAEYTLDKPQSLKISGTATVERLEVAIEPLCILGDAQALDDPDRLGGHLPAAFTRPRAAWHYALDGGRVGATTGGHSISGWQRWCNDTPGGGDGCEMTHMLFVWAGYGLNDINAVATTNAARAAAVADVLQYTGRILRGCLNKYCQAAVIGLPPYSVAVHATTHKAKAIQEQINRGLEGLAVGMRAAYINPWWFLVDPATASDLVPVFDDTYTVDAGVNYNAAGAALVASLAAAAYESGVTPAPDNTLAGTDSADNYSDATRIREALKGIRVGDQLADDTSALLLEFLGDCELLFQGHMGIHDKIAMHDYGVDFARWLMTTLR